MNAYMTGYGVQLGASYPRSEEAGALVRAGNAAAASLVGSEPGEIVLTGSTTMSAYILSRGLGPSWREGDNIVVTDLDHEANIGAWRREAEARGVEVREWRHDTRSRALEPESLTALLDERTRLVSFTHCPNVTGSIHDAAAIVARCRDAGALVCVDGVAYAPHRCVDVKALDADFYLVSLYKVFGPHQGLMYGKRERLLALESQNHFFIPDDEIPYKLQPGNVNHELAASLPGIVAYLEGVARHHGDDAGTTETESKRPTIALRRTRPSSARPSSSTCAREDASIIGRDTAAAAARVATVAFELERHGSREVVEHLQRHQIAARFGDFMRAAVWRGWAFAMTTGSSA